MEARLYGKVAIVTGGASGIGRSCAVRLAAHGAVVAVTDIDDDAGAETVALIEAVGGAATYQAHDVTDEGAWQDAVAKTVANHGRLDVLVNNAGIAIGGSIVDMRLADWQRQQAINLDGVFLGVKHAIPAMQAGGGGSIINMSSVAGLKGSASLAAYNATKGGVRLFTKGVALECAQKGWNIRVNSVHPGIIDTPIWTKINAHCAPRKRPSSIRRPSLRSRCPAAGSARLTMSRTQCSSSPPTTRATSPAPNSSSTAASQPEAPRVSTAGRSPAWSTISRWVARVRAM